ncbi:MAG: sulfurtransferase TusA family protein [Actinobacteria bacterium]|nr:MAG: sulfurtransferase TusA family protein [Actinomycetota bacterium]
MGSTREVATARRFVEAVMSNDRDAAIATLAPAVRFRHLLPRGPREIWGADETVDVFLGWFGDARELEVQSLLVEPIADRTSVRYRVRLHENGGWEVVQQQQFLDMDEAGRIAAIDLLCSGFRPDVSADAITGSGTHRFDAGTMGCADGLAREFRRRILAIPLGDILEVETTDPAAKEDLPPLARMMGHTVRSTESTGDGRLLIEVERGR